MILATSVGWCGRCSGCVIVRTPDFAACDCGTSYVTLGPGLANHVAPATPPAGATQRDRPSLRVIEGGA